MMSEEFCISSQEVQRTLNECADLLGIHRNNARTELIGALSKMAEREQALLRELEELKKGQESGWRVVPPPAEIAHRFPFAYPQPDGKLW